MPAYEVFSLFRVAVCVCVCVSALPFKIFFSSGASFGVSGGMTLDATSVGAGGFTGGIYTEISAAGMSNVPTGRHFYDIELVNGSEVTRILEGKFDVRGEVSG